jgi:hypothetical protein
VKENRFEFSGTGRQKENNCKRAQGNILETEILANLTVVMVT